MAACRRDNFERKVLPKKGSLDTDSILSPGDLNGELNLPFCRPEVVYFVAHFMNLKKFVIKPHDEPWISSNI